MVGTPTLDEEARELTRERQRLTNQLEELRGSIGVRTAPEARGERTTILVAHRLTTLRDANRILVFDRGRIVEVGTYAELVAKDGVFAELVRSGEE